jgi:hypothetical protein
MSADVTGGKPIAVWSQPNSGVSAVNPLVAFYDIHGRKREVLLFYFVPHSMNTEMFAHKCLYYAGIKPATLYAKGRQLRIDEEKKYKLSPL